MIVLVVGEGRVSDGLFKFVVYLDNGRLFIFIIVVFGCNGLTGRGFLYKRYIRRLLLCIGARFFIRLKYAFFKVI